MKKNRILFRADGNVVAGYGHIIRLLSLAAILRKKYSCIFIMQQPDDFLRTQILSVCDGIIELPETKNFSAESKTIAKEVIRQDDIVVLDGYDFTTAYQLQLKKACFKLVCIDDLYDRHFISDVVINHGEGIKSSDYSKESYTKLYLGTQYAILRKSFLVKRKSIPAKPVKGHRAFVNMGGTDRQNYTQKALDVCIRSGKVKEIDVVTGSFYAHKKQLQQTIASTKHIKIRLHSNLVETEMAALMKSSSVAVCSASTISYEYSCVGGILFVYQTVMNQKNIYSFLVKTKVAFPAADFNKRLSELGHQKAANNYFKNRLTYFSGDSAKNLAVVFKKLECERGLTIRRAVAEDVLTYYRWVNDADVRANSINTAPILLGNHKAWFSSRLKSKSTFFFIIQKNSVPLGQVRFDRQDATAEIDYSVGKKFRGKGYGEIIMTMALKEYRAKFPGDTITAKAKEANTASNRVFLRLGFNKNKPQFIDKTRYNTYSIAG